MRVWSASFEAIGVTNTVAVDRADAFGTALRIGRDEIDALDRACSRFRDDSELAAVNRAAGADVPVGALLLEVVEAALRVSAATHGLVDPTVGRALPALGYDRDFRLLPGSQPGAIRVVPAAGWRRVRIDRRRFTIRVPRGSGLDLGAVAKALAADRIARRIRASTDANVLVCLGGDLAVAGSPDHGWPVGIAEDHRRPGTGPTVAITDGGLATSGTTARRWSRQGRELHHIVDPATGLPAREYWRTVTVAAGSCLNANAASTAAIVMGEPARDWLESLGLAARLVRADGSVSTTVRWPAEAR